MIINTDLIYPIGAIYLSVSATNPATLFGGKWEQIKDRFLLAAGDTYAIGTTGGEATHKLTVDEMPIHSHDAQLHSGGSTAAPIGGFANTSNANSNGIVSGGSTFGIRKTGGDAAHNNMPPYLTVYMWKRVA